MDTLGKRLRAARSRIGMTRKDLADKAGVPYSTLADIENDATGKCTTIAQLSDVLGVAPLWLEIGRRPMLSGAPSTAPTSLAPDEAALLAAFRSLGDTDRELALIELEYKARIIGVKRKAKLERRTAAPERQPYPNERRRAL